ncbi:MAG: hydroxymethylbilane synthase [Deltaproteobacteria bacterium]|nr:hydroxymethylbilane synthase [Deltaproteobacteria bacterium]
MRKVVIGSRGSQLALWQSEHVRDWLTVRHPGFEFPIEIIHTMGDKILDVPLAKIGDKGLFTKEIENALLDRRIDLAVHSLKDLPTKLEAGLAIGAISVREDVRDAWVSRRGVALADLPEGATVATSSLRRRSQLWARRPDLRIVDMRGNLNTRMRKLDESDEIDGLVLAAAGLVRLGWETRITHRIEFDAILPAVGQGALAVEIRADDAETAALLADFNHADTQTAVRAERAFLRRLEGGCQIPIGAHATVSGGRVRLDGLVGSLDGTRILRDAAEGDATDPEAVGIALAGTLLAAGADAILAEITAAARS